MDATLDAACAASAVWFPTMELRFLRDRRLDIDPTLQQKWKSMAGEEEWREIPHIRPGYEAI